MKRIIDGKRYDTDTAEHVAEVGNDYNRSDFRWEVSNVYTTKRAAWFIAGKGGPMSRWARKVEGGGTWTDGEGLEVLTQDEARELLEQHNAIEALEQYFEVEEG